MQPLPYSAGYSAAKAYLLTFSEAIHQELRGLGVTVTVMCPGPVSTDFWEISGWQVQGGQTFESAVPKPAWITPAAGGQGRRARARARHAGRRPRLPGSHRDAGCAVPAARVQAARDRVAHAQPMSELLPRPVRLLLGATSRGTSDAPPAPGHGRQGRTHHRGVVRRRQGERSATRRRGRDRPARGSPSRTAHRDPGRDQGRGG